MKTFILALLLACTSALGQEDDIASRLQSASVTLNMDGGECSGTVIQRDGETFVLTAGHCMESIRTAEEVVGENGQRVLRSVFEPVKVIKEIYHEGRSVGKIEVEGDVIAFSSAERGHDIALLRVKTTIQAAPVVFAGTQPVRVGVDVVHVGSLGGLSGSNSFTTGTLSQVGRVLRNRVFDQATVTATPGSSGGGIFLRSTGAYVGMLVRGSSDTHNLYVPNRRIWEWAKLHRVEFLFDPAAKMDLPAVRLEVGELAPVPKESKTSFTLSPDDSMQPRIKLP